MLIGENGMCGTVTAVAVAAGTEQPILPQGSTMAQKGLQNPMKISLCLQSAFLFLQKQKISQETGNANGVYFLTGKQEIPALPAVPTHCDFM